MKVKVTLSLKDEELGLIRRAKGKQSLASFVLRSTLKVIAQEEQLTHLAPDTDSRNKACLLRCLENGCASVEDIESVVWSLSQQQIEAYLSEMEREGLIHREKAKRGRMWRWNIGPAPQEEKKLPLQKDEQAF